MTIRAFAFDLDGTLVDSIADLARAANAARADLGLPPLAEETVQGFVGDGAASLVARTLAGDHAANWHNTAEQQQAMARFDVHYKAGLTIATRFYPEVQETLHSLHELEYPLAIVTNKPERYTLPLLRELGISERFDVIVSGDTLAEKKPSPLPLQFVLERLSLSPEQLLMVGDSKNDVLAAKAAGTPSVLVSYGYGRDVQEMGADHVIRFFSEVLEFID
ncbi:phosphoglycolate phosphatase [Chitiniphilus shinanonensis]|uniref:Phosphoglycolate phosphatase n=1 Tax=Chitiniphilus shinanonensis TaxID=553088 RepID=A0ABQ6BSV1_9NEIS|nr:phosphoglycolate phosphatase [Chitiniphilus shinanonensis]GLS04679.1 phosphoglycolate phosphatase [Chitiniphilus shinanonensis]